LLKEACLQVVFYCHFPDQLLTQRKSLLKKLYRLPLDLLEEITTAQADQILVNSRFTASVFKDTFRRIKTVPAVLYPAVNHVNFPESDPNLRLYVLNYLCVQDITAYSTERRHFSCH